MGIAVGAGYWLWVMGKNLGYTTQSSVYLWMRFLIPFFVVITFSQYTLAQRVPSDCETQDSANFWYGMGAARLSILELQRQGSPYYDSIPFPDSLHEKKLRALGAVYNVTGIPEADTIAHIRPVHDLFTLTVYQFFVIADENLAWMQNLENQQLPCGHPVLDSLLVRYNITTYSYDSLSVFGRNSVKFTVSSWLNIHALTKLLDKQPDIESYPISYYGDGSRIDDSVFVDHIELTYSHGWGDCMAGCMFRRFWKFKVYDDCSVQFVESYGSALPPLGIPKKPALETWSLFPNPFTGTIEIGNLYEPCDYALYSPDGRLIKEGTLNGSRITDLEFLPKGLYILHLQAQDSNRVFRVSKE